MQSAVLAVMDCVILSIRLSVCLSVCRSHASIMIKRLNQSTQARTMRSSLGDSHMTLVSLQLSSPRNSEGNIGSEGVEWERGRNNRHISLTPRIRCPCSRCPLWKFTMSFTTKNYCHGLSSGEDRIIVAISVLTQCQCVADRHTDTHTRSDRRIYNALHSELCWRTATKTNETSRKSSSFRI